MGIFFVGFTAATAAAVAASEDRIGTGFGDGRFFAGFEEFTEESVAVVSPPPSLPGAAPEICLLGPAPEIPLLGADSEAFALAAVAVAAAATEIGAVAVAAAEEGTFDFLAGTDFPVAELAVAEFFVAAVAAVADAATAAATAALIFAFIAGLTLSFDEDGGARPCSFL
jgi:hypothetical protein